MSETTKIGGRVLGETTAAYRFSDGTRTVWLPKSQVQWDEDDQEMEMPEWLATERGLV